MSDYFARTAARAGAEPALRPRPLVAERFADRTLPAAGATTEDEPGSPSVPEPFHEAPDRPAADQLQAPGGPAEPLRPRTRGLDEDRQADGPTTPWRAADSAEPPPPPATIESAAPEGRGAPSPPADRDPEAVGTVVRGAEVDDHVRPLTLDPPPLPREPAPDDDAGSGDPDDRTLDEVLALADAVMLGTVDPATPVPPPAPAPDDRDPTAPSPPASVVIDRLTVEIVDDRPSADPAATRPRAQGRPAGRLADAWGPDSGWGW